MQTTQAEQTVWEVWDEEDTRLYQRMLDVEQDMIEAESEVRSHDEQIAEMEEELVAARVRRSRFTLQHSEHTNKLESAKRKYRLNHDLEPVRE
jgi:predicted  nucleic acid-binding Zn-ribbon protein